MTSIAIKSFFNRPVYEYSMSNQRGSLVICTGPAGTGKTMLACKYSMRHFREKTYTKMVITRPNVNIDEDLGYLRGNITGDLEQCDLNTE